jgi:Cof subfamily protein (haloacid dehalogenase superfamily)
MPMNKENKSAIRLVAVDLDGTLFTSQAAPGVNGARITPKAPLPPLTSLVAMAPEGARLLRVAALNGTHVILATGRVIDSVRILCNSLETNSPAICIDGAHIYESIKGPVLHSFTFPKSIGLEIARLADNNGWELVVTVGPMTYYRQRPGQPLGPFAPARVIVPTNMDAVTGNPSRILVWDPEAIKEILNLCKSCYPDQCRIEKYHERRDEEITSIGIFGREANKGNSLALVLHRLKINPSQVMVIGDDLNDLPMFSHARIKVAMGNAQAELKNHATVVAPNNDNEGVAWALKQFAIVTE